jgi:cell division protein FtsZ
VVEIEKPKTVVDNTRKRVAGDGTMDYSAFDQPTVTRRAVRDNDHHGQTDNITKDMDYLDIPAFLRRQAD